MFNGHKLDEFLLQLGINKEESAICTLLADDGILTPLQIARQTGINRTRVYRLLENLKKNGFIEEIVEEHRKTYKLVEENRLELFVKQQEIKAKYLRSTFPVISHILSSGNHFEEPGTKVLFYRGVEGIKQQVWNTLKAEKEAVGYSYRPLIEIIGSFYHDWKNEWIHRNLVFRDMYSDEYVRARSNITIDSISEPVTSFISKYISSRILNINYQIDLYNNVISYYNWHEGEVVGVEIYNDKMANLQKQLFEIVWKMAK